jgi:UDP-glucuronate 4-epimerase
VRYSLQNPKAYINSNIYGFFNILEACRHYPVNHLLYASSSSVYGLNTKMPLSTSDNVDHPISLYAATKKSNELMAHTYSHLYGIPSTGLRFFTVYGPWGRPDMAPFIFTRKILAGESIDVYNYGNMERDFTYIDDIIEGLDLILNKPPEMKRNDKFYESYYNLDPSQSPTAPFKIYNIGNSCPIKLLEFITTLQELIDKKAKIKYLPLQPGDVEITFADINKLKMDFSYHPKTKLKTGLINFINWINEAKYLTSI